MIFIVAWCWQYKDITTRRPRSSSAIPHYTTDHVSSVSKYCQSFVKSPHKPLTNNLQTLHLYMLPSRARARHASHARLFPQSNPPARAREGSTKKNGMGPLQKINHMPTLSHRKDAETNKVNRVSYLTPSLIHVFSRRSLKTEYPRGRKPLLRHRVQHAIPERHTAPQGISAPKLQHDGEG